MLIVAYLIYAAEGESSRWCGCSIRSGSTQPSRAGRSAQLCEVFDRSGAVGALCQPVWRNAQSSVGYCRLKGPNLKCADLRIFGGAAALVTRCLTFHALIGRVSGSAGSTHVGSPSPRTSPIARERQGSVQAPRQRAQATHEILRATRC